MHVDDPKGDREAMDKEEFRHLAGLDLAGRRHRPLGTRDPAVARGQLSGIHPQGRVVFLLPKLNESLDCNMWVLLKKGDKRQTTSGMDQLKRSLVRSSEGQLRNLTSGQGQVVA